MIKKRFFMAFSLALALTLSACGEPKNSLSTTENIPNTESEVSTEASTVTSADTSDAEETVTTVTTDTTRSIYKQAYELHESGDLQGAYELYTSIIDYGDVQNILPGLRAELIGDTKTFVDEYGTEFIYNTYTTQEYTDINLRFWRNDILAQNGINVEDTTEEYFSDESVDNEWKKLSAHVYLLVDTENLYAADCRSGYPYSDLKGESGDRGHWGCWLNFDLSKEDFDKADSIYLLYDSQIVCNLKGIPDYELYTLSTLEYERENVYKKALQLLNVCDYEASRKQFLRLYNYKDSDLYLDLLNTYTAYTIHTSLNHRDAASSDAAHLDDLIAALGINFIY